MSLCDIPLLTTSLETLHEFASDFEWMFLGWTPTQFDKIEVLPLFFDGVMVNFVQFLANI